MITLIIGLACLILGYIIGNLWIYVKETSYCIKCRRNLGLKILMLESSDDFRCCPRCGYMEWY